MIKINGTTGEGGGQVLRTALSLSAITGQSFTIKNIRGARSKPGLRRQHLTCVEAAAQVCDARISGAEIGSTSLTFNPGKHILPGRYSWDIGTAGSTTLVLQTVLPILSMAGQTSHVEITGGTHNPMAPPVEFIQESFLPVLDTMGFKAEVKLKRYGFFPRGGGVIHARIKERTKGKSLYLVKRPPLNKARAFILHAGLPDHIAQREKNILLEHPLFDGKNITIIRPESGLTGNVVWAILQYGRIQTIFTSIGIKGKAAEQVAKEVCTQIDSHEQSSGPVDSHLADQLLLALAIRGDGCFATRCLTLHAQTNMEIINQFLPTHFTIDKSATGTSITCQRHVPENPSAGYFRSQAE
ncbi:RNA 3'-terminal phosphate cyclase [Thermodesulfobacteriota bacterium]